MENTLLGESFAKKRGLRFTIFISFYDVNFLWKIVRKTLTIIDLGLSRLFTEDYRRYAV